MSKPLCTICHQPVALGSCVEHETWEYPNFKKVTTYRHAGCRPLSLQPEQ